MPAINIEWLRPLVRKVLDEMWKRGELPSGENLPPSEQYGVPPGEHDVPSTRHGVISSGHGVPSSGHRGLSDGNTRLTTPTYSSEFVTTDVIDEISSTLQKHPLTRIPCKYAFNQLLQQ